MMKAKLGRLGKLMFGRYLLLTNTASCGTLLGVGDTATQTFEIWSGKKEKFDFARTGRLCVLGTVLGPINHFWYGTLDRFLVGTATKTVVKKILLDQLVGSPVFAFTFFMGVGTLQQQPLEKSWTEFKDKFWQVYMADWCLWPAAQTINFKLLAPRFRVIYVASVTCVWNSFLSFMKHKEVGTQQELEVSSVEISSATNTQLQDSQKDKQIIAVAPT